MKIVSWNINSVRLRLPLLAQVVAALTPDILCLQETKTPDECFPHAAIRALGFEHLAYRGEKGYNGVAILSKIPLANPYHEDFGSTGQTRHLCVTLPDGTEIHNCYIPAGGDIADPLANPKFAQKLAYVRDISEWSARRKAGNPAIILGDFNIAPLEQDVWSHKQMLAVVSHTPIETQLLQEFLANGNWVDSHRHFIPASEKLYSWWSYRAKDWQAADRGRRLDHLWVSPSLVSRLRAVSTLKQARGWESPSDHVPIMTELA
jgi:exodeoxyribonuclease-3